MLVSAFSFRLHPALDVDALRGVFARDRRVRISPFLHPEDAAHLREHLAARGDWRQIINSGDKVFELDRATRDAMTPRQREALDDAVMAGARYGFQYRYESIRVSDGIAARRAAADPLNAFAAWMSGGGALALMSAIVGAEDIVYADAQATAYGPGDLLTGHDDAVPGKDRRAAYVLGLNPEWRPEWGGLLLFHEPGGHVDGLVPSFNTLDLFAVPKAHSVSMVTGATSVRRYSVTGWLRSQLQPQ